MAKMEKNWEGFSPFKCRWMRNAHFIFLHRGFNRSNLKTSGESMRSFIISFLLLCTSGFGSCSQVPQATRDSYASEMYQAFITQSYGKSTIAFYQFDVAREKAKQAGESLLRIIAMETLFAWFRMYANSLNLYHKRPTGHDRIIGEYRPTSALHPLALKAYESEWGNTPEQARIIREFFLGIGEVIAGVFCATVSGGALATFGAGTVAFDGAFRMFSALNALWATHQAELAALKMWENNSLKPAVNQ